MTGSGGRQNFPISDFGHGNHMKPSCNMANPSWTTQMHVVKHMLTVMHVIKHANSCLLEKK